MENWVPLGGYSKEIHQETINLTLAGIISLQACMRWVIVLWSISYDHSVLSFWAEIIWGVVCSIELILADNVVVPKTFWLTSYTAFFRYTIHKEREEIFRGGGQRINLSSSFVHSKQHKLNMWIYSQQPNIKQEILYLFYIVYARMLSDSLLSKEMPPAWFLQLFMYNVFL